MVEGDSRNAAEADHVVLRCAREEAARLGHSYIGAEHLLLGILQAEDAEVLDFLRGAGVSPEAVRLSLEAAVPGPEGAFSDTHERPLSSRAKKVISLVEQRVRSCDRRDATCRDFLEAIFLEGRNIAAHVLHQHGVPGPIQMSPLEVMAERLHQAGITLHP